MDWVASGTQSWSRSTLGADRGAYVAQRARRRAGDHRGGSRLHDDLGLVELLAVVNAVVEVAVLLEVVGEIGGGDGLFVVGTRHHLDDLAAAVGQVGQRAAQVAAGTEHPGGEAERHARTAHRASGR